MMTPLKSLRAMCGTARHQLGTINTLHTTVSQICKAAGVTGYKTFTEGYYCNINISNGVEEQLIMSRAGHRSGEGV